MSLRHNCHTCSIPNLHRSNIIPDCSGSTHLILPESQLVQLKFTFILFSQTFASYSIVNYIWNTSKLLLLSDDVEINPGPRPIDQNPVFCTIFFFFFCYSLFKFDIQNYVIVISLVTIY